ncbi:MAG: hypothetical protein MJ188_10870 [Treponema sp.]|nr:hypothetical protein [Treponema sp.]
MKKYRFLLIALLVTSFFVSCGKKNTPLLDECGCFLDMESAKKQAAKNNQDILVIVTSDGDDYISQQFISDIIKTKAFEEQIGKKYTIFHFDFSQKAYEKTVAPENATKEEKQKAEQFALLMQTGYQFACLLDCKYTPSIFLLTKDGYVISEVEYEDEILDVDDFSTLLQNYNQISAELNEKVLATTTGTNLEKVVAIDELYNSTEETYQPFMLDLAKQIPTLDKKNESGLIGKYLVLAAESEAIALYTKGDIGGAVKTYVDATSNPYMEASQKQECYYLAAYLLGSSGSEDYNLILNYLNLALSSDSTSDKSDYIQSAISYYKGLLQDGAGEKAPDKQ